MIVENRVIKSFVKRIRENVLEFDFYRQMDVGEAATADSVGRSGDMNRGQDAVVQPLETQVDIEDRVGLNGHEALTELLGNNDLELVLAHLAGTMDEVVDPHRVGRLLEFVHNIRVYRPRRPQIPAMR